jgi:hypothetical protein
MEIPYALTMNYTPRISTFFGELGKGEAPYDLWKYEVDTLRRSVLACHSLIFEVLISLFQIRIKTTKIIQSGINIDFLKQYIYIHTRKCLIDTTIYSNIL